MSKTVHLLHLRGEEGTLAWQLASLLDNDRASPWREIGLAESDDTVLPATFDGADVDEEDLVMIPVELGEKELDEGGLLASAEVASEHRILNTVTVAAHDAVDLAPATVIGNIIGNNVA